MYDDDRWSLSFGLAAAVSDSCELIGLALIVTVLLRTLAGSTAALEVALDPH